MADVSTATNEELLRKVIEAQFAGGCRVWEYMLHFDRGLEVSFDIAREDHVVSTEVHILAILLDTDGCKAAYGSRALDHRTLYWRKVSAEILDAWHSGAGNDVRKALETAVSFLPND